MTFLSLKETYKKTFGSAPPRVSPKKTVLYWPNWSMYKSNFFPFVDVPYHEVTHICYAFFGIDPITGSVKLTDPWMDIEKAFPCLIEYDSFKVYGLIANFFEIKKMHRNTKLLMSIGGWSQRGNFKEGVSTCAKLDCFVESAVKYMLEYGFDGIDLDWEYPENSIQAAQLLEIVQKLHARLNFVEGQHKLARGSFLLTIAAPALVDKLCYWDLKEINKHLSFWNLMAYDFAGEWSDKVEYHCNLFKTRPDQLCGDDAVNFMINQGVPPGKIVLGMAAYGRIFAHTKGYGMPFDGVGKSPDNEKGIWPHKDLPIPKSTDEYDPVAVAGYCFDGSTFVTYDNSRSVEAKAQYIVHKGLGGGMWWELTCDKLNSSHKSLLHQFITTIGGQRYLERSQNIISSYEESEYLKRSSVLPDSQTL